MKKNKETKKKKKKRKEKTNIGIVTEMIWAPWPYHVQKLLDTS